MPTLLRTTTHHRAILRRYLALGDQVPWKALEAILATLEYGSKVHADNPQKWRLQTAQEHLEHALAHYQNHVRGDRTEEHLGHMICRQVMMGEKMLEGEVLTMEEAA